MKSKTLLLLILFVSRSVVSQDLKQIVADKNYMDLAFEKCAPIYKELASKKRCGPDIVRKAAESYRMLNNSEESEKWYAKLLETGTATPQDRYYYAQVLLQNKKYKEAKSQMDELSKLKTDNSVAKRYAKINMSEYDKLKKDSLNFTIKNLEAINSPQSDFGPSYITKTELGFASARANSGFSIKQFAWDNSSFLDIYTCNLDTSKQTASDVEKIEKQFKSVYHDGPISYSPDGKTMLLTRNNYLSKKLTKSADNKVKIQLYYAVKLGDKWSDLIPAPFNDSNYNCGQAIFSPDGKTVYFVSDMPGTYGATDIWQASFSNNTFGKPSNLGQEVNTEGREMFPFVDKDNLLLFSSDGYVGLGGLDIHMAQLSGGYPSYVGNVGYPLNTNADDFGLIYDSETLKGYFSSNRVGGAGSDDIYSVKMSESLRKKIAIHGFVYDARNNKSLPSSKMFLYDAKNNLLDSTTTDNTGEYHFDVSPNQNILIVSANKESYYPQVNDVDLEDPKKPVNLLLSPTYSFVCNVTDMKTGEVIEGVKITSFNNDKAIKTYTTDANGKIGDPILEKKYGSKVDYKLKFEKEGYITNVQEASFILKDNTLVNVGNVMNTQLQKLEKGVDLGKVVNIKPIYFDLGKSNIRPDAAIELDKIIAVMNEYPTMVIELGSHTDCRGTVASNLKLSDLRAKSSAKYIQSKITNPSRIYGKGYGESRLLNNCACEGTKKSNCSEEEHQKNRRTEFIIIKY